MYSQLHKEYVRGKLSHDQDRLKTLLGEGRISCDIYQAHYDNHLYAVAIKNKTSRYANALIEDAFAICGDPFYQMSRRRYGKAAQAFLDVFRKAVMFYPSPVGKMTDSKGNLYNPDQVGSTYTSCHVLKCNAAGRRGITFTVSSTSNPYELARQKAMYYRSLR